MPYNFDPELTPVFFAGDVVRVNCPDSEVDGRSGKVDTVKDEIAHLTIDGKIHYIETQFLIYERR